MSRHTGTATEKMLRTVNAQLEAQIAGLQRALKAEGEALTTEKALADDLYSTGTCSNDAWEAARAAYRKARGIEA